MNVAVIGTGYVGLVTGVCLAHLGHSVVCVDQNPDRAVMVNNGVAPFHEPGLTELLKASVAAGRLRGTTELGEALINADLSIIAVGTPSADDGIDLTYVERAGRDIGRFLPQMRGFHTIVLKSTCVPGTSDTFLRTVIEKESGRRAGEGFGLAMNPEFLREGSAVSDFMNPDRIVIGADDARSGDHLQELYSQFDCPKLRTSLRNAEMIKYASNAVLATLISFSNEIAGICEGVPGLDESAVMAGLHLDRRLSPMVGSYGRVTPGILSYLRAGIGYGGSCFPKDTVALQHFAASVNVPTPLLDAVIAINADRAARVISLLERSVGSLQGRTVTVLGLAFKPDTDDVRESPGISLAEVLLERGAVVRGWDPLAASNANQQLGGRAFITTDIFTALEQADLAIVATAWSELAALDWQAACSAMRRPVIFDGRSVILPAALPADAVRLSIGMANNIFLN